CCHVQCQNKGHAVSGPPTIAHTHVPRRMEGIWPCFRGIHFLAPNQAVDGNSCDKHAARSWLLLLVRHKVVRVPTECAEAWENPGFPSRPVDVTMTKIKTMEIQY